MNQIHTFWHEFRYNTVKKNCSKKWQQSFKGRIDLFWFQLINDQWKQTLWEIRATSVQNLQYLEPILFITHTVPQQQQPCCPAFRLCSAYCGIHNATWMSEMIGIYWSQNAICIQHSVYPRMLYVVLLQLQDIQFIGFPFQVVWWCIVYNQILK